MRNVVLDANRGRDALLRVQAERQLGPTNLLCKLRRKIIRMQVGCDDVQFGLIQFLKIGNDAPKGVVGRFGLQIANVLAKKNLIVYRQRDGVFKVCPDG